MALLDHPRLIAQLGGLERRTARGGKDSIDHAPGAHDDVANAAAGVLSNLTRTAKGGVAGVWGNEVFEPPRRPKIIYVDSMDGSGKEPRVVYTTEGSDQ